MKDSWLPGGTPEVTGVSEALLSPSEVKLLSSAVGIWEGPLHSMYGPKHSQPPQRNLIKETEGAQMCALYTVL